MEEKKVIADYCQKIFQVIGNLKVYSSQTEQIKEEILDSLEIMKSSIGGEDMCIFPELCLQFVYRVFLLLVSQTKISETKRLNEKRMQKIDQYIRLHCDGTIHEDEVARDIGMSTRNFCRFFVETQHCKFSKYLNQSRIKLSIQLLMDSNDSIVDIAYRCGFSSPNYFCRIFKSLKGMTPQKYREVMKS